MNESMNEMIYQIMNPNISGFIAQLVRASQRHREVTGSNPVDVLKFSDFSMQLLKLRSQLRGSWLHLISLYESFHVIIMEHLVRQSKGFKDKIYDISIEKIRKALSLFH